MRSLSDALHPARRWMVILAIVEYALLVGRLLFGRLDPVLRQ
jgi:hypothetical protein